MTAGPRMIFGHTPPYWKAQPLTRALEERRQPKTSDPTDEYDFIETFPPPGTRYEDADAYQMATRRTGGQPAHPMSPEWREHVSLWALGLAGEAGEAAEVAKKVLHHGIPSDRELIREELGDALFYLARQADEHGLSLSDVMTANLEKVWARYPRGFVKGGGER